MLAVPTSQLPLCIALRQLETITWSELKAGYDCRQRLDEESLTSYHLMRLATAVPAIVLEKHYRGREARTGADWEWWVGSPGAYIGLRVQAKILNAASLEYASLYSSRKNALVQVDKLIDGATNAPQPLFPVYAFYNYWWSSGLYPARWTCPRPTTDSTSAGWTLASAYDVRDHLASWRPSKKLYDLSRFMYPVSCLFCCDCTKAANDGTGTLAQTVAQRVRTRWVHDRQREQNIMIHEVAPAYVERMFKGERADDGWQFLPPILRPRERKLPRGVSRVLLLRDLGAEAA
jgi:hypothetical protein